MMIDLIVTIAFTYFMIGVMFRYIFCYSCGAVGLDCICLTRIVDFIFTWYFHLFDYIKEKRRKNPEEVV